MFRPDKIVMKTKGLLASEFQRFPRLGGQSVRKRKRKAHEDQQRLFPLLQACSLRRAGFGEFVLERGGLADALRGSVKSLLRAHAGLHLALHVLAQMAFQFIQDVLVSDTDGQHLPAPFQDFLFEVKHFALSTDR